MRELWWSWSKVNLGTANIECEVLPCALLLYYWNSLLKMNKYFSEANWLTEIIGFCLRPVIGRFFAFTSTWTWAMASIESIGRINASGDLVMGSIEGIADEFQLGIDDGPCWPSKEKGSYDIACYCRLNYIWIKILTTKKQERKVLLFRVDICRDWRSQKFLAPYFFRKQRGTRLTYNCAHLRSIKESLTFEYDT